MIELNKEQLISLVSLYDGSVSQELEYAYREAGPFGEINIKVCADDFPKPNILLFINGFTTMGGVGIYGCVDINTYDQEIKELILGCFNDDNQEVWVHLFSPDWELKLDRLFNGLITNKHYRIIHRLNRRIFQNHTDWRKKIPSGYTMKRYDTSSREFIKARDWQDFWHPQSDRFGWFLFKDEEAVSECFSVWVEKTGVEKDCVEISIDTKEPYRRKGFAFLTSIAFIEECLSRSLIPVWCCWSFREGSKELAEKLGFEIVCNRRVIVLNQNKA